MVTGRGSEPERFIPPAEDSFNALHATVIIVVARSILIQQPKKKKRGTSRLLFMALLCLIDTSSYFYSLSHYFVLCLGFACIIFALDTCIPLRLSVFPSPVINYCPDNRFLNFTSVFIIFIFKSTFRFAMKSHLNIPYHSFYKFSLNAFSKTTLSVNLKFLMYFPFILISMLSNSNYKYF